jgi:hypothetical protein
MVNLIKASVIMLLTGKPAGIALCSEQVKCTGGEKMCRIIGVNISKCPPS